ncbi:MAG: 4-hydroxy-3-methylbut-2-en-1-yl diphosphate synthase, partial [Methylobacterium sp.]
MEAIRSESPAAETSLTTGGPEIAGPAPRHRTVGVTVGEGEGAVMVGGGAPIVVQSMTNTDT